MSKEIAAIESAEIKRVELDHTKTMIIDFKGVMMQVDLEKIQALQLYKIGDPILILYNSENDEKKQPIWIEFKGIILDFLNYDSLPSLKIGYLDTRWYSKRFETFTFNKYSTQYKILPDKSLPLRREIIEQVLQGYRDHIHERQDQINDYKLKMELFENNLGKLQSEVGSDKNVEV